ncbi:MAG: hypothetical protein ACLGH4_07565 [Actinomycetes bacterium]
MVGAGLVLLAVAAVLTWAVDVDLPYVDDGTLSAVLLALGLTLVVAGVLLAAARADGSDDGAAGLGLLTLGMVLVWGLEVDVPQVEDTALGVILMVAGGISVAATLYLDRQRTSTRRVVELRRGRDPRRR